MNRVNCACLQQSLFHHMQHSARHTNSFTTTVRIGIWPVLSPSHWSGRPNSQGSMHLPTHNHSTNYPPGSINYFLGQLWGPAVPHRYQGQPQGQELPALVLLWQPPVARQDKSDTSLAHLSPRSPAGVVTALALKHLELSVRSVSPQAAQSSAQKLS